MYGTKYILPFTNNLGELYEIYFDFLNYTGTSSLLQGTDDVLKIQCTAGDEDKLQPILGTEALINIWIDQSTSLSIFDLIATVDNEIRVTVYRNENYTTCIFQGFVVVEDNSQPFLDPPFALFIRALDGLGLLKNVDLGDLNNLRYVGVYSIVEWIMQILYKTDQTLNLRVYFNFYEASMNTSLGALAQTFLDAITFSTGDAFNPDPTDPTIDVIAQSADDCYTALEKIVRCFRCRLFQENGVWNLVSLYEYLNSDGFTYYEYAFGTISNGIVGVSTVATAAGQDYTARIGKNEMVIPVLEDQLLYLKLATKWIKLTFTYNQSQNKICNQDFSEGTRDASLDQDIPSSIIDTTITPDVILVCQGWDTYCWNHFNGVFSNGVVANPFPQASPDHHAYTRIVVDQLGYTLDTFLVIENSSVPTYMESAADFLLDLTDSLKITMSIRTKNSHDGAPAYSFAWVLLTADDGTFWALGGVEGPGVNNQLANEATWHQVDSTFRNTDNATPTVEYLGVSGGASNTWTDVVTGGYAPAITPRSGRVRLYLVNASVYNDELWFKNLQVQVTPYLQGSYEALQGDYNYSATNLNIKQTESDTVEISDSPKRYFTGALLKANGDLLSTSWHRAGVSETYRFTQAMEYVMYNHLRRIFQKIEGTFRGLIYVPDADPSDEQPNGFLNSYPFSDHPTPTKRFMLTSFEKDYATGQSKNVYIETLADANDEGWTLPDAYQFDYVFQT